MADAAHLAMSIAQLVMQRTIAVLQLLHLPLQLVPCTMGCCQFDLRLNTALLLLLLCLLAHLSQLTGSGCLQVCQAVSAHPTLLLPAHPKGSSHMGLECAVRDSCFCWCTTLLSGTATFVLWGLPDCQTVVCCSAQLEVLLRSFDVPVVRSAYQRLLVGCILVVKESQQWVAAQMA